MKVDSKSKTPKYWYQSAGRQMRNNGRYVRPLALNENPAYIFTVESQFFLNLRVKMVCTIEKFEKLGLISLTEGQ